MKFTTILISVVAAIVASYLTVTMIQPSTNAVPPVQKQESSFERVLRTGEIRAGYIVYPPYFIKDPNTGEFSGIFFDITEDIARKAGLTVKWTEEVGYGEIFTALNTKRFDIFAAGLWPSIERAKAGIFTIPVSYSAIFAWGRMDEERFSNLKDLNNPTVRISAIDGEVSDIVAHTDFSKAKKITLPQLTPYSNNYLNIKDGKADVVFAESSLALEFLSNNKGSIRNLFPDYPVRVFGNSLVVGKSEIELKEFLDTGIRELLYSGQIERIIIKYEKYPNSFMRVAKPYEVIK